MIDYSEISGHNTLVYDCFSGISGDMHIGAMLDLGVPLEYLRDELARLHLADEFQLVAEPGSRLGIHGTLATIRLKQAPYHHRHLADVQAIIQGADYPASVAQRALDIFQRLAEAEARVHGIPVERVHFHEVGATDAIADIVAAALCLEYLGIQRAYCTMLELGGGLVKCQHGLLPVPAPATAEILKGVPCREGGVDQEATTPTGAAILRHVVDEFQAPRIFTTSRIGHGLGQKQFAIPNVLRVRLGHLQSPAHQDYEIEHNQEIQCNIDDMSPEAFQPLTDALFQAGARDVFLTPVIMKKSRPATRLSVLTHPEHREALLRILFRQSTTIGVRMHSVEKFMLPRKTRDISTNLGEIPVKIARLPGGGYRWKLEHDQVLAMAKRLGKSYLELREALIREVADLLGEEDRWP